jgi:tetratricopeptide (TPR) repeat protein
MPFGRISPLKCQKQLLTVLGLLAIFLSPNFTWAQEQDKRAPKKTLESPREPLIRMLIKNLGAADWEARESARRRLLAIGDECLAYLEKHFKDEDRERAWRARELYKAIRWKVPQILLDKIGPLIEDYTTLTSQEKLKLLGMFQQMRSQDLRQGASFLAKMIRYDKDSEIKEHSTALYMEVSKPALPQWDRVVLKTLVQLKDSAWSSYARAVLYQRSEQLSKALVEARKAYKFSPASLIRSDLLISLFIRTRAYKEALPLVQKMTRLRPEVPAHWVRYGECLIALGRKEKGLKVLAKILKIPGADKKASSYVDLSAVFLRLGFAKEALKTCQMGLKKFPYNRALNVTYAESEWAVGKKMIAFRRFLSEMRYAVPNTDPARRIRKGLRRILKQAGCQRFGAQDEFWKDLERGRPVAKAHDRLARWLEDRGLNSVVVPELKLVALMWADDVSILLRLGAALEQLGEKKEALKIYQRALKIDPKNIDTQRALQSLEKSQRKINTLKAFSGLSFWERNFERGRSLVRVVPRIEGPFDPPPLVTKNALTLARPDISLLTCYSRKDGAVLWNFAIPAPSVGELVAGQVGVETLGLVEVPAAVAMRTNPERAFVNKPLFAVVFAAWERDAQRKAAKRWNGAFFRGLWVTLLEPENGRQLTIFKLPESKAPRSRLLFKNSRAVYRSQRSESRHRLSLIDLAAGREVKHWRLKGRKFTALRACGDSVLVSYKKGRFLYERSFTKPGQRLLVSAGIRAVVDGSDLHILGQDDNLYRMDKAMKAIPVMDKIPGKSNAGMAVHKKHLLLASISGNIQAYDIANKGRLLWQQKLDQGAERGFHFSGPVIFTVNGIGDTFPAEVPYIVGLDRKTGALVWKRPFETPATFAFTQNIAVVVAGGRKGIKYGKLMTVKIGKQGSQNKRNLLVELRSAALDAFQRNEFEVSNLLFRLYREQRPKSAGPLSIDDAIWHARILARSNRPIDAENVLASAEGLLENPKPKRFHKLRKEMGLETEEWPDEKKDQKKNDKPDEKKDQKKNDKPGEQKDSKKDDKPDEKKDKKKNDG